VENLATFRPLASHGGSGYFFVCSGSNDSPHFAQHQQIQLARRRKETRSSIGSKLSHARRSSCSKVLTFGSTAGAVQVFFGRADSICFF
jgi:hypothetical protein